MLVIKRYKARATVPLFLTALLSTHCTGLFGGGGDETVEVSGAGGSQVAASSGDAVSGSGSGGGGGVGIGGGPPGAGGAGGSAPAECPPPEGKIPGVGLGFKIASTAVFFPPGGGGPYLSQKIDASARPWGCSGNDPIVPGVSDELWLKRYGAPGTFCCAQGYVAELFHYNQKALENAFNEGLLGDPNLYTGIATTEEQNDLSTMLPRGDAFYCNYAIEYDIKETDPGITPENPDQLCWSAGTPKYFTIKGLCNRTYYYQNTCWQAGDPYYDNKYPHVFGEMP